MTGHNFTIPVTVPRLRHTQEKVKLFPSSHWLHTAEKFSLSDFGDKDVELSFVDRKAELAGTLQECRELRRAIKNEQGPQVVDPVPDILIEFPPRPMCDVLVAHYLRVFELIYRVFHIPSFWKEYEQYWTQPPALNKGFSVKLSLVMTIGLTFCEHETADSNIERLRQSSRSWIQAAQWWLTGPSEKSTKNMDGIQISCLLLLARQVTSAGPSPWLSEGSLLHMAMAMGLHRDPKLFRLSPFQAEFRTRLWTTVLELVLHGSMNASIPLLLSSLDFDDRIPQNIEDEAFGPESENLPSPRPITEFTQSSIQIFMRQSLHLRMEAARLMQNLHREQSHDQAIDLATKLQRVCRDVATHCRIHWNQAGTMHPDFLDMQLRRYILVLHRPFMLRVQKEPRFYISQKICLESAMIIASHAERIKLPSTTLDDLSRLMIMSTGTFRGPLTLEIITILSLHVLSQLEDSSGGNAATSASSAGGVCLDPLAEMARAQRAPIMRVLEHIKDQLLQIIKLGHPTLKRYVFLAGVLSQIRAMESGQRVQTAVIKTAQESLKECYEILQSFRPTGVSQDILDGFTFGEGTMGFDFGIQDTDYLDLSSFLLAPV
ncbi:related to C6 transcription factor [Ramularia collo-cygni]|uniref:Related to C6 transcription factor n=1 Tax=Ramularia collo-cygni TaxID=112498 RepID=A0A2D3VD41_9PEZI|nr:related to C6 transcription factor [Ramularia collo-cygni]CZT21696.1 related to C6 transcription factor [Ramularia collo-cygni]